MQVPAMNTSIFFVVYSRPKVIASPLIGRRQCWQDMSYLKTDRLKLDDRERVIIQSGPNRIGSDARSDIVRSKLTNHIVYRRVPPQRMNFFLETHDIRDLTNGTSRFTFSSTRLDTLRDDRA